MGSFTGVHQRFWDAARRAHGDSAGTKVLVGVLHRVMPAAAVQAGTCSCLRCAPPSPRPLSYAAFLTEVLSAECEDRAARRRIRRANEARFPRSKRLSDLDLSALPEQHEGRTRSSCHELRRDAVDILKYERRAGDIGKHSPETQPAS